MIVGDLSDMPLATGARFGVYEIVSRLGAGGMGEVWRARDPLLEREVALKVLPATAAADETARARMVREARMASRLNHPNICTVHELGEAEGQVYIAMELVEGEVLSDRLLSRRPTVDDALRLGQQIAEALAHAHAHGVVHRDLKCANVIVTPEGRVKVLDFGLAKPIAAREVEALTTLTQASLTDAGAVVGTLAYMAPEQLRGSPADELSDVWALGVVLYELATGGRPFAGRTSFELTSAILSQAPRPLPDEVPEALRAAVGRCLEKDPAGRFGRVDEVLAALESLRAERAPSATRAVPVPAAPSSGSRVATRLAAVGPRRLAAVAAVAAVVVGALAVWQVRAARVRWARNEALPRIAELVDRNEFFAAFQLALEAERRIPGDPALEALWDRFSNRVDLTTEPPGAEVFVSSYAGHEEVPLGRTPLTQVRTPRLWPRCRLVLAGFEPVEGLFSQLRSPIRITLDRVGTAPPGMVRVTGGEFRLDMPHLGPQPPVTLPDYWIGVHEVTNRDYKRFVDAGGYADPAYWREAFVDDDGRELERATAMARLHDRTGRPGPATWEAGTYPEGAADLPVTGVSWYEAMAYAAFSDASLPSVYHWVRAAGFGHVHLLLPESNFARHGLAPVGRYTGISDVGASDMAGNAKEWCLNAHGRMRFILGGAWDEPTYQYSGPDALPPLSRPDNAGLRLAKLPAPPDAALLRPLDFPRRDFSTEKPVGDAAFAVIRGLFSYDATPLRASVDAVDDGDENWRRERVSFDAAYGGERVTAHVFLPRGAAPPYQAVVFFPGSGAIELRSSADLEDPLNGALVKAGRAFVWPIYKGTFERQDPLVTDYPNETELYRQHVFAWYKDLARTLDYLQSRSDIDASRLAYFGFSWGARMGPLFLVVEPRLRTGVLLVGGLKFARTFPELDPFNFAPRVTAPVLMINARNDFYFPLETSQLPLYHLLGTPPESKRHVVLDSSHGRPPTAPAAREVLDWLDRYLGPVTTTTAGRP